MFREVSDLSSRSLSDDEGPIAQPSASQFLAGTTSLWKSYENPLTSNAAEVDKLTLRGQDDDVAESEPPAELPGRRGQVHFNTAFEPEEVSSKQEDTAALPASWSACDNDDLGQIAAVLAAAGVFTAEQVSSQDAAADSQAITTAEQTALEADDMLGLGTLDLRTCTLVKHAPVTDWQQIRLNASFSRMPQGDSRIARTGSVFRYGSTVGEQLQALAIRPGRSFSAGLRLRPKSLGISFSDLKKKIMPHGEAFDASTYLTRLHQHTDERGLRAGQAHLQNRTKDHHNQVKQMMKEHLKGVSSSFIIIDNIRTQVLKIDGPNAENKHSVRMHTAIDKAQAAASTAFQSIIERQGLVERAQQEMQLAARYTSVLGLTSSMQAHCRSRRFNQILPSYQQATALIQAQAAAAPARAAKRGTLQHIMDQALEAAGAEVLKQLTNDSMSSTQLQHGLDLLLHLEAYWPPGIMPAEQSVTQHLRSFLQAKAKSAHGAVAQALALWRIQDMKSPCQTEAASTSTQYVQPQDFWRHKAIMVQEEDPADVDVEWELLSCIALLQHMPPPQALEQTSLLMATLLPCMTSGMNSLWQLGNHHLPTLTKASKGSKSVATAHSAAALTASSVQSYTGLCRQIIQGLLDGLEGKCRASNSATAASCAACLVQLTHMLADVHASLTPSRAPANFAELLAESSRQCCALCIGCACQQVQSINLRLATSDLFQTPSAAASGPGTVAAGSSLEACLTALLHTCHAFTKPQYAALLEPHISEVWSTYFATFEAFSRSCEQLSISCATPHSLSPPKHALDSSVVHQAGLQRQNDGSFQPTDDTNLVSMQEAGQSSSCKLLMLLSRCELMQQLLARLVPGFLAVPKSGASSQDWQAQAVQCEGDISFQQGQMQQAYISHICSQLQQPILACVQNAAQQSGVPQEAQEDIADLLLMLVQIQSDLLSLAPRNCITQIMRMVVKHSLVEWQQQMQLLLPASKLCAALQLYLDLQYLEPSMQPYLTAVGTRVLSTSHAMLLQSVIRALCSNDDSIAAVQAVHGACHMSTPAITAWLAKIGEQAKQQTVQDMDFSMQCIADGAACSLAAMSLPALPGLSELKTMLSGVTSDTSIDAVPASPRRLMPSRPVSYVHSRLIGAHSGSAAALAAQPGKFGRQQCVVSTPFSPGIRAVHAQHSRLSSTVSSASCQPPWLDAAVDLVSGVQSLPVPQSPRADSRHELQGSSTLRPKRFDTRMGSVAAVGKLKPPRLHAQASISLTAMTSVRLTPLQIPP